MLLHLIRRVSFVIVAAGCVTNFALSQPGTSLFIRVTDAQGATVPDARVVAYPEGASSGIRGNTNIQGAFSVGVASGGTFVIEVDAEGFRKNSRIVVIRDSQDAHEDFSLEVAGVSTSVVVTAADAPQTVDQITKALTVIDSRQILDRNEYKLAGVLSTVPGVQVRNGGGPGQFDQIRVRGLRADATAVLVDGMRFRDATTTQGDASSFLSNLNFIAADRVEVLRGSGSSLYGTNAAGGVVNIVTDEGGGTTHGAIQAEGGSLDFLRGRTQIGGGALGDRLKYTAGLIHLNVMRGVDGNDRTRSTGAQAFLRYDLTPRTIVSGRVFASDDFVQLNVSPATAGIPSANTPSTVIVPAVPLPGDQIDRLLNGQTVDYGTATYVPGRDDPDSRRSSRFHSTAIKFQHRFTAAISLQTSYHKVHTSRVYVNGPAGVGFQPIVANYSRYMGDIDTIDARSNVRLSQWNQWTAGYEFERESYADVLDNKLPEPQRVRTQAFIRQNANAAYFQNQSSFFRDRLQISLSGRVQSFKLDRPMFQATGISNNYARVQLAPPPKASTGDLSLSYFTGASGTKVRAHFGNAYRVPALYERFGGGFFSNTATGELVFTPYGDPSLSPDRYNSVDGGVDQYFWRDRVRVSATYFYTRVVTITAFDSGTVIKAATDPYGRASGYINGSGGLSRGVELSMESRPTGSLTFAGSYTYTRANLDRDITVREFWRVLGVPRHTATLVVTQRLGRRAMVAVDLTGNSEIFGNFTAAGRGRAFQYPGFIKADLSASFALKQTDAGGVKMNTRIENILNRTYYDLGWLAPRATFVTGLSFQF